jgi:peptide/nickel transport system permease protein/oligopeptide transport system permease protein
LRASRWATLSATILLFLALVAILAPLIAPETYAGYDFRRAGAHPELSWPYLLGADATGHSILSLLTLGARATLAIGAVATLVSLGLGAIGAVVVDRAPPWAAGPMLFVSEVGLSLLILPFLILLVAFVGGGNALWIGMLLGLVGFPAVVTGLRAGCQRAGQTPESGSGRVRRVVLGPDAGWNLMRRSPATSLGRAYRIATLALSAFIVISATIDFLGFGVPPTTPSWGNILSTFGDYMQAGYWWWLLFPGLALVVTLVAINIVGVTLVNAAETAAPGPETVG